MFAAVCTALTLSACGGGGPEPAAAQEVRATLSTPVTPAAVAPAVTAEPATTTETAAAVAVATPLPAVINAPVVTETQSVPPTAPSTGNETGATTGTTTGTIGAIATAGGTTGGTTGGTAAPSTPSTTTASGYLRTVYVDAAASSAGSGSSAAPYKTIASAMSNMRPGDDVVIAAGTYREWVVVPALAVDAAASRIRAATARSVTIKGSLETAGWTQLSPGVYALAWAGNEPEQVFRAGTLLKQIGGTVFSGYPFTPTPDLAGLHASEGGIWTGRVNGGVDELTADSFTYDAAGRRLVVKVSTPLGATEKLEVSVQQHVLQAESANKLTVEGIDFAHSNTTFNRRWGAVKVMGKSNTLRNVAVRDMDGTCVQIIGEDNSLLDSTIERCGQTGVSGHGWRLTIANNQVLSSNTRGFNKWWEAGGIKLIGDGSLHDSVIRNNVVAYNGGDGIWLDTMNTNILIESNTTAYNAGFGVHYEASQSGIIRGNRAYGNSMRGIYLFESSSTLIEGNAAFGNVMEGIGVVDGGRSAADPALKPLDNRVINNTMAWNDFQRNWVQLVLPGDNFRSVSENNSFKAEMLAPRMSMGFMSLANPAYERLDLWRSAKRVDLLSTTQTLPMPADLKAALAARRLLTTDQLPQALSAPGSY